MKWSLFLYYCAYCISNNIPGKTYDEFFRDRELVVMIALSYFKAKMSSNE